MSLPGIAPALGPVAELQRRRNGVLRRARSSLQLCMRDAKRALELRRLTELLRENGAHGQSGVELTKRHIEVARSVFLVKTPSVAIFELCVARSRKRTAVSSA